MRLDQPQSRQAPYTLYSFSVIFFLCLPPESFSGSGLQKVNLMCLCVFVCVYVHDVCACV